MRIQIRHRGGIPLRDAYISTTTMDQDAFRQLLSARRTGPLPERKADNSKEEKGKSAGQPHDISVLGMAPRKFHRSDARLGDPSPSSVRVQDVLT